jgi:hypothetical protein
MSEFTPNTQTLVHVGLECIAIGGVVFWVHRRLGPLETTLLELNKKVDALESKTEALENVIRQQHQIIMQHESFLRQAMGDNPPPIRAPPSKPQPVVGKGQSPVLPSNTHPPKSSPIQAQPPAVKPPAPQEEIEVPPDVLDKILDAELGKLSQSSSSEIEIETSIPKQKNIKRDRKQIVVEKKIPKNGKAVKRGK